MKKYVAWRTISIILSKIIYGTIKFADKRIFSGGNLLIRFSIISLLIQGQTAAIHNSFGANREKSAETVEFQFPQTFSFDIVTITNSVCILKINVCVGQFRYSRNIINYENVEKLANIIFQWCWRVFFRRLRIIIYWRDNNISLTLTNTSINIKMSASFDEISNDDRRVKSVQHSKWRAIQPSDWHNKGIPEGKRNSDKKINYNYIFWNYKILNTLYFFSSEVLAFVFIFFTLKNSIFDS